MKLLIAGFGLRHIHLKGFADTLKKYNIECKVVVDSEIYDGFPSRKIRNWFQTRRKFNNLIKEFKPDAVFIDRQRHFGIAALKAGIPLFVHLKGDYWKEMDMARKTLYKSFPKRIALNQWDKIAKKCFENATVILPTCKHLDNELKKHYPNKKSEIFYQGITPSQWIPEKGMKLKHPCVGLLQGAVIWEKAKEMLTLKKVMESMPDVTFYWAGDGPYRDKILPELERYENFQWLGKLKHPEEVKKYLSEIDVYALISGIDMSPVSLLEAQILEKPVVATNVGGIPEEMQDNETGFLVDKENHDDLIEKLSIIFNDPDKAKQMGVNGKKFVENNFSWEKIAENFIKASKKYLDLK
ncbi:MAG: glycosyltransferase family 4 protein [Nitrosopumilus sp.]|uniref:glycosyltransferase family 4 protein n=1 Tax=Nitrosopumilus sp. TaxID=2024843 RepID=UPI002433327E|nr:glycosyltransferase family 4 protein [Nitrosopumilus sp.]MCV0366659.1 glycosyltransferase family 4 protein [Nitrosopumilus sp.]